LVNFAILEPLHIQAHATGATSDRTYRSFQVRSGQVWLFGFGNFFQLSAGNRSNFAGVGASTSALDACSFLEQYSRGRSLGNEGKATVAIYRDYHGRRQAWLKILSRCVKRLTELHDVHTALTQSRSNGGARVCLAGLDLKLDIGFDFLCHSSSCGFKRTKCSPS